MPLPLVVRPLRASETNLVLAAWKNQLYEARLRTRWGRDLPTDCFWALVNHVIDKITLPSSTLLVGCHVDVDTPMCWAVVRDFEVLYIDARPEIRKDPALAVALERQLLHEVRQVIPIAPGNRSYNPFMELKR